MNAHGTTVFLDVAVPLLVKRLRTSRHKRPLIEGKSAKELASFVEQKLEARRPFYEQADIIQHQTQLEHDRVGELSVLLKTLLLKSS